MEHLMEQMLGSKWVRKRVLMMDWQRIHVFFLSRSHPRFHDLFGRGNRSIV